MSRDSHGDELLTVREARAAYGIPRTTLYRHIRKGEVRAYRRGLGRETFVHRADLEALLRFHPKQRQPGSKSIWDEMDEFRRRVFGDRVLTPSSAEIIEEERRKRDEENEYDLAQRPGGVQGKYVERYRAGTNLVLLAPEVAKAFPNDESVNEALRLLMKVAEATVALPK